MLLTPGRQAVIAALLVNLIAVLPLFLTGAMAVQIGRDLGTSPPAVGALASLFALASLTLSAPLGRQVRRLGIQRSLRVSSVIAFVALAACALAPSVLVLGMGLFIAGTGNGLGQSAGNALVSSQISPSRFGLGFAIKQSAIPLATTLGGFAVPVIALTTSWRVAFFVAALAALLAMLLIPPDRQLTAERTESVIPRAQVAALWVLALGAAAVVVAASSIGALGAAGGVAVGLSEGTAGYLIAAGGLAGLAVRLISGAAADRFVFDSLRAVAVLCLLGAIGWIAMSTQLPLAYAVGLIVANAFGWGWPGLLHLSIARRFPTATAAASGVSQTGVALGVLVGPVGLSLIATGVGWPAVWVTAAASVLLGAVIIVATSRRITDYVARPQKFS